MQTVLTYEIDKTTYNRYASTYDREFAAFIYFGKMLNVLTDLSFTRIHCSRNSSRCIVRQYRDSLSRRASCLAAASELVGQFREHYQDEAAFQWFEHHWFTAPHEQFTQEPPSLEMQPFNLISYDAAVRKRIQDLDIPGDGIIERASDTELLAAPEDPNDLDQHREIYESVAEVIDDLTKCYQFCAVQFIQCMAGKLGIPEVTAKTEKAAA